LIDRRIARSKSTLSTRFILTIFSFFFSFACVDLAVAQSKGAKVSISTVRFGFFERIKAGRWFPINIDLQTSGEPFQGSIRVSTDDSDDVPNEISLGDVVIEADVLRTVSGLIRLGKSHGRVRVDAVSTEGRVVATGDFEIGVAQDPLNPATEHLIVSIGGATGLIEAANGSPDEAATLDFTRSKIFQEVAPITRIADLPTQWIGYDGVDTVLVTTHDPKTLDEFDPIRKSALESYVRQGGRLVICSAANWSLVDKDPIFSKMLPAKLKSSSRIRQVDEIERHGGAGKDRIDPAGDGLDVASVEAVNGQVILEQQGKPLIIRGSYGLGVVTLITFDPDAPPISNWKRVKGFWSWFFNFMPPVARGEQTRSFGDQDASSDVSSRIVDHLERFTDVTIVPFSVVAGLIFGYILLIGPIDYLLLKKVFGKLEWTWFTFPIWVALVSLGAYYGAYYFKGSDLRINRIEIVDVDLASRSLRGTGFMSIFSPRIERYDLQVRPDLAVAGPWSATGAGADQKDRYFGWFGTPGASFRTLANPGSVGGVLSRRGYRFGDSAATSIEQCPIPIWSLKSFMYRWVAQSSEMVKCELIYNEVGGSVRGTIENKLPFALTEVAVVFREKVYMISRLEPATPIDLGGVRAITKGSYYSARNSVSSGSAGFNPEFILREMSFSSQYGTGADLSKRTNHFLAELDLQDRIDQLGRAMILATVDRPAADLWLNAKPTGAAGEKAPATLGKTSTRTYLRMLVEPKKETR
jgi:hypothetical protein